MRFKNAFPILKSYHVTLHGDAKMPQIKSFVFMDLETTGLPQEESNRTRITELSFSVVQSDHIRLGVYPRVRNKLNLCLNPQKLVHPISTQLTGLANDILEQQSNFTSDTVATINNFLSLSKGPLCFVAHNGNKFDYPILKSEINRVRCSLSNSMLCLDSLDCFKDLYLQKQEGPLDKDLYFEEKKNLVKNMVEPVNREVPLEFSDGFDKLLSSTVDAIENEFKETKGDIQKINETTPIKSIIPSQSHNFLHSFRPKVELGIQKASNRRFTSFKLVDIYKRLTSKIAENAHFAEGDVDLMIHCAATYGDEFVDWANRNAKLFSDIPMMVPGKRIGLD